MPFAGQSGVVTLRLQGRGEPRRDVLIAFAVERASLGVTDQYVAATNIHQHGGGYLSGMRTLRYRVEGLRAQSNSAVGKHGPGLSEIGERREHREVDRLTAGRCEQAVQQ